MLSVRQAQREVRRRSPKPRVRRMALEQAAGLVLAAPVNSPSDSPRFDNSAMDGYALAARAIRGASPRRPVALTLHRVLAAGKTLTSAVPPGHCVRIMTGAPLPKGADCVVPREEVTLEAEQVVFRAPARKGNHVRKRGEELKKGTRLAEPGQRLNSRALGALAGMGVEWVKACCRPRVAVFVTGSELVQGIKNAAPGKIFDSNGPMLRMAVAEAGGLVVHQARLADRPAAIRAALNRGLKRAELVLVAGGVSVGDFDWVKPALKSLGVRQVFWRVAQKPGKPLFFGTKGDRRVFGLPGNPAAAWTCFQEYVRPLLASMAGLAEQHKEQHLTLLNSADNPGGRLSFLKARRQMNGVRILGGQGSHMLTSLAQADCFVLAPPATRLRKGQRVLVHPFETPFGELS